MNVAATPALCAVRLSVAVQLTLPTLSVRPALVVDEAYGRSEEASKASETEKQLVHLQRPSEKRLTIESSSVSQWACLQYARGRVRCQSQWISRIGTYAEGRVRRTAPAVIAAHRQWWNTPHHRQL